MERRWLIRGGTALGLSAALRGLRLPPARAREDALSSDVDVLNFVLAVAHVQSALYTEGDEAELLAGDAARLLVEIGADVRAQIVLLRERIEDLGADPVEAPRVDLSDALEDREAYLELAERLENAVVQGLLGLLPTIDDADVLELVAAIYGVKGRHAALVADLAGADPEGGVFRGPQELSISTEELVEELSGILPDGLPGIGPTPSPRPTRDPRPATPRPATPGPTPQPTSTPTPEPTPAPTPRSPRTPDDGGLLP